MSPTDAPTDVPVTQVPLTTASCTNSNNGATDRFLDDCSYYEDNPGYCGSTEYDDEDFVVDAMCCVCSQRPKSNCQDTAYGALDIFNEGCAAYKLSPGDCDVAAYSDDDFTAASMCCACGGGVIVEDAVYPVTLTSFNFVDNTTSAVALPYFELMFNGSIDMAAFNVSWVTLSGSEEHPEHEWTLTTSQIHPWSTDDTLLVVMSIEDLVNVFSNPGFFVNVSTAFLTLTPPASAEATDGVPLVSSARVQVDNMTVYFEDEYLPSKMPPDLLEGTTTQPVYLPERPRLAAVALDLGAGHVQLTFDTAVNGSTLDLRKLTLHCTDVGGKRLEHTFLPGTLLEQDNVSVLVALSQDDFVALLLEPGLQAADGSNTYFSAVTGLVLDMYSQGSYATDDLSALHVDIIADATPPVVLAFNLDLINRILTLELSEPVRSTTVAFDKILLRTNTSATAGVVALTGGIAEQPHARLVKITLLVRDVLAMQAVGIGKHANTTFLTARRGAVRDVAGNPNAKIAASNAVQVSNLSVAVIGVDDIDPRINGTTTPPRVLSTTNKAVVGVAICLFLFAALIIIFIVPFGGKKDTGSKAFFWNAPPLLLADVSLADTTVDGDATVVHQPVRPVMATPPINMDLEWDAQQSLAIDHYTAHHVVDAAADAHGGGGGDRGMALAGSMGIGAVVVVQRAVVAQQDDELECHAGERLVVVRTSQHLPNWVYARNAKDHVGLVAADLLRPTGKLAHTATPRPPLPAQGTGTSTTFGPTMPASNSGSALDQTTLHDAVPYVSHQPPGNAPAASAGAHVDRASKSRGTTGGVTYSLNTMSQDNNITDV